VLHYCFISVDAGTALCQRLLIKLAFSGEGEAGGKQRCLLFPADPANDGSIALDRI